MVLTFIFVRLMIVGWGGKGKYNYRCKHTVDVSFTKLILSANFSLKEIKRASEKNNVRFPTMSDFLELHEGKCYILFCKEFLKRVVGEKKWKGNCYRLLLSEFCSASGEAFC